MKLLFRCWIFKWEEREHTETQHRTRKTLPFGSTDGCSSGRPRRSQPRCSPGRPAACVQGSDGLRCETLVPGRIGRASKAQEDPRPAATSSENAGREHFCHRTELLPDRAGAEGGAGCTPRAKSGLQTVRLNKALSASGHAHSWLPSRPKAGSRCRHRTTWPTKLKRFTIRARYRKRSTVLGGGWRLFLGKEGEGTADGVGGRDATAGVRDAIHASFSTSSTASHTHALSAQKRELKQKTLPSGNAHLSSRRWLPKGLVLTEATLDVTKLDTFTKRMGKKKKKKGISLL